MGLYLALLKDACTELWAKKLRTFLTLLGMIFGVGAVIAMLNIGEGAEREALQMINSMGANNLIIKQNFAEKDALVELREQTLGLTMDDIQAAKQTLPFINNFSASKTIDTYSIYSDFGKTHAQALGVTFGYFQQANLALDNGSIFSPEDEIALLQVAVIGADVADELFPNGNAIGGLIKVNHLWLTVIGVIQRPQTKQDEFQGVKIGGDQNRIFLPLSTAQQKLKQQRLASELDEIKLGIVENYDPRIAALAVDRLIAQRHGDVKDYQLIVPAALLEQLSLIHI